MQDLQVKRNIALTNRGWQLPILCKLVKIKYFRRKIFSIPFYTIVYINFNNYIPVPCLILF